MGNHRFKLADIIPNAWLYKLKEMGRRSRAQNVNQNRKKKHAPASSSSASSSSSSFSSSSSTTSAIPTHQFRENQLPSLSHQRKSYYFTRDLATPRPQCPDPPRKSSKQSRQSTRRTRASDRQSPRLVSTTISAGCGCRTTVESVWAKPDSTSEDYPNSPLCSSSDLESLFPEFGSDHDQRTAGEVENDIVIDMNDCPLSPKSDLSIPELELPPIITTHKLETKIKTTSSEFKERETRGSSLSVKIVKEAIDGFKEQRTSPVRGLRLRTNSPRIAGRKVKGAATASGAGARRRRRSLSESCAVVKASVDPQRDFRESMVEMIVENNIRASKDLEDLLACYLQLNSDEHHELIIRVFKQIWSDLAGIRLK